MGTSKTVGDESRKYGQVGIATYGALVSTANLRLMRLRKILEDKYDNLKTDALLAKVLSTQEQGALDLVGSDAAEANDVANKEAV